MKIVQSITLEPCDFAEAVTDFLKKNNIVAGVTEQMIIDGLDDDLNLSIDTSGVAPTKAPVKRRRRTKTPEVVEKAEEPTDSGEGAEKLTLQQEANQRNIDRIAKEEAEEKAEALAKAEAQAGSGASTVTEKQKAVNIADMEDDGGDDITEEEEAVMEAQIALDRQALIDSQDGGSTDPEPKKEEGSLSSSVPKEKKSIFSKRKKA